MITFAILLKSERSWQTTIWKRNTKNINPARRDVRTIRTMAGKQPSASQAEGHEFEPRLPLLRKHSLIIKLLTIIGSVFSLQETNYTHSKKIPQI